MRRWRTGVPSKRSSVSQCYLGQAPGPRTLTPHSRLGAASASRCPHKILPDARASIPAAPRPAEALSPNSRLRCARYLWVASPSTRVRLGGAVSFLLVPAHHLCPALPTPDLPCNAGETPDGTSRFALGLSVPRRTLPPSSPPGFLGAYLQPAGSCFNLSRGPVGPKLRCVLRGGGTRRRSAGCLCQRQPAALRGVACGLSGVSPAGGRPERLPRAPSSRLYPHTSGLPLCRLPHPFPGASSFLLRPCFRVFRSRALHSVAIEFL